MQRLLCRGCRLQKSALWGERKSHVCKASPTRVRARSSVRRDGSRASALTSASVTLVHQPRCTASSCLMPACAIEARVRPVCRQVDQCMPNGQPDTASCRESSGKGAPGLARWSQTDRQVQGCTAMSSDCSTLIVLTNPYPDKDGQAWGQPGLP